VCVLPRVASTLHKRTRGFNHVPLAAGVCDGMTYKEVETAMPEEFAARAEDKLHCAWEGGQEA
jgi:hypothetical protein